MADEKDPPRGVVWSELDVSRGDSTELVGKEYLSAFARMELVLDKLKLLHFEKELMPTFKRMGYKVITRDFFAWSHEEEDSRRGRVNLFFPFIALCQWLLGKCGHSDFLREVDIERQDPATSVKELGNILHGMNCRIPEGDERKLMRGYGPEAVRLLHLLADEAVSKARATWRRDPEYTAQSTEDGAEEDALVEDDNCEVQVDDEDSIEEESDEYDDNYHDLETIHSATKPLKEEPAEAEEPLDCEIDPKDWREEVERVLPSLKVNIRVDSKDWRTHMDQMEQHKKAMESSKETKEMLEKLSREIQETLTKIDSRESYINRALDVDIQEYSVKSAQLMEIKAKYKKASTGISERTHRLMTLTEELDRLKIEMEERGSLLSNTEPLKSIKTSIQQVKTEITQMDMRIGVLQNILLHSKSVD